MKPFCPIVPRGILSNSLTVNRTVTGSSPVAGAIRKIPLETRGFFHFQRLLAFLATLHVYPSAEAVARPAVHAYDERTGSIKQRKEVHHVHWRSFLRRRGKHVFRPQPRLELLIRRKHPGHSTRLPLRQRVRRERQSHAERGDRRGRGHGRPSDVFRLRQRAWSGHRGIEFPRLRGVRA